MNDITVLQYSTVVLQYIEDDRFISISVLINLMLSLFLVSVILNAIYLFLQNIYLANF